MCRGRRIVKRPNIYKKEVYIMKKKKIISITGELASGKTVIAKIITEKLNYGIYKNGEYFRKLAKEHNMDVTSFNKYVEKHPEIDHAIEKSATEYAKTHEEFVIDARLRLVRYSRII